MSLPARRGGAGHTASPVAFHEYGLLVVPLSSLFLPPMDLKTIKFPLKNSLKKSSNENSINSDKSPNETPPEEVTKSRLSTNLSSIDLDPLKVKDSMGKLGGKMKSSFNKISDKIPIPKIPVTTTSTGNGGVDEFDQAIINIETDTQLQQQDHDPEQQDVDNDDPQPSKHSSKNVIHTISNVKGKLNKFGKAAKQKLSTLQQSNSVNHEENESAHSNGSDGNNPSLTAIARLGRNPFPFQSSNVENSTPQSTSTPQSPPSNNEQNKFPEDFLEEEIDENSFKKLSRRPSEFLEFENVGSGSTTDTPPETQSITSHTQSPSGNESISHTPFLNPKVKKFLKGSLPSSKTPPLEVNNDPLFEEIDPYYQPYGHHHHQPSLSKFLSIFTSHLSPRWCQTLGREENFK